MSTIDYEVVASDVVAWAARDLADLDHLLAYPPARGLTNNERRLADSVRAVASNTHQYNRWDDAIAASDRPRVHLELVRRQAHNMATLMANHGEVAHSDHALQRILESATVASAVSLHPFTDLGPGVRLASTSPVAETWEGYLGALPRPRPD